jgi:hypothetical protein
MNSVLYTTDGPVLRDGKPAFQRVLPGGGKGKKSLPPTVDADGFYAPDDSNWAMEMAGVFVHVSCWIIAIVFDHLLFQKASDWAKTTLAADGTTVVAAVDTVTETYALAALITGWLGFGAILVTILMHRMSEKGFQQQADSVILGMITAGVRSSFIFTLICALFTVGVSTDRGEDWRTWTIVALVMKVYLNNILSHNISKTGSITSQQTAASTA